MTSENPQTAKPKRAKAHKTPKAQTQPSAPPAAGGTKTPKGKLGAIVALMRREGGATIPEMMEATGWQAHSVRGALAGALKKKFKFEITSTKAEGAERRYTIVEAAGDQG